MLVLSASAHGGTFVCNPNCLNKIASSVAIAANMKSIVAGTKIGAKKIAHPKRKVTKATK